MSGFKGKRKNPSQLAQQLSLETRDYITSLFKRKFTYEKPELERSHVTDKIEQPSQSCDTNTGARDDSGAIVSDQSSNTKELANDVIVSGQSSNSKQRSNDIKLPNIGSTKWSIKELQDMKDELNALKSNLNDKEMIAWHVHTRRVNLAGHIAPEIRRNYKPELCTQAWCKFYEIASTYLDIKPGTPYLSVHLCEAPGAFVTSLNHYLHTTGYKSEWSWLATTLNPYYEGNNIGQMIDDDSLIRHTRDNWHFGGDGTGNLMSLTNLQALIDSVTGSTVNLVTADGSIDCQGVPSEQEDVVSRLQHCEAIAAMNVLSPGGDFVLKMFTLFECKSICLMYLLYQVFDQVHVFKPCTSKGGNSEVYVICLGYCGVEKCRPYVDQLTTSYFGNTEPAGCLFTQSDIPADFLKQHYTCANYFKDCQMTSIQRNLDLYKVMSEEEAAMLDMERDYCMESFLSRYNIVPMVYEKRIKKARKPRSARQRHGRTTSKAKRKSADRARKKGTFCGSFQDRENLSQLQSQQIQQIETDNDQVDNEDNSLCVQPRSATQTDGQKTQQAKDKFAVRAKKEGKFCGSFQDRENLSQLPWQQRIQQIETYDDQVDNKDNSLWIQHQGGSLADDEIDRWQCLCGQPIPSIQSSRFCNGQLIFQTHELIQNVQWLAEQQEIDAATLSSIVETLVGVLHVISTQDCQQTDIVPSATTVDTCNPTAMGVQMVQDTRTANSGVNDSAKGDSSKSDIASDQSHVNDSAKGDSTTSDLARDQSHEQMDEQTDIVPSATTIDSSNATVVGTQMTQGTQAANSGVNDIGSGDNVKSDVAVDQSCINEQMVERWILTDKYPAVADTMQSECGTKDQGSSKTPVVTTDLRMAGSPVIEALNNKLLHLGEPAGVATHPVLLYSASSRCPDVRFELSNVGQVLDAVLDIILTCVPGTSVVLELGPCLTRLSAGLVYILYRCFTEIGFVHHHGNLLQRHLVCVSCRPCPIRLLDYVKAAHLQFAASGDDALLEIVPVSVILEDAEFVKFLRISNNHLLQSFVTTVVHRERRLHPASQQDGDVSMATSDSGVTSVGNENG